MNPHYDISRYVLQLYPPLIFLAAAGAVFLCGLLPEGRFRKSGTFLLIASWCFIPWFFRDPIRGTTRQQQANRDIIELEARLPGQKPIFVLEGISILYQALKYDCGREVYPVGSFSEARLRRTIEDQGALYVLRSRGTGWTQLPATIRQYRIREILKKDAGDPFGSPPYYVYEILPERLAETAAGTASAFPGAVSGADHGLPIHITYSAGAEGIARGGGLRICFPGWPWLMPQDDRPGEAGYLSVVTGPGDYEVPISLAVTIQGRQVEIILGEPLAHGEILYITLLGATSLPEDRREEGNDSGTCFPFFVDLRGEGEFKPFPLRVCLDWPG